ncbi:hypothetical protein BCR43DRAFT_246540 [Syncephalastrum racemosum]|uniref:Uncharacterized protein n=1 Tax=Syncephalastrum racemosum TaxID=13706 RepID=A0A1X2HF97_SYNRA|nr:hypothetical protein BCR43DRAFT_246540 [Syncephalastrum racemosum]
MSQVLAMERATYQTSCRAPRSGPLLYHLNPPAPAHPMPHTNWLDTFVDIDNGNLGYRRHHRVLSFRITAKFQLHDVRTLQDQSSTCHRRSGAVCHGAGQIEASVCDIPGSLRKGKGCEYTKTKSHFVSRRLEGQLQEWPQKGEDRRPPLTTFLTLITAILWVLSGAFIRYSPYNLLTWILNPGHSSCTSLFWICVSLSTHYDTRG